MLTFNRLADIIHSYNMHVLYIIIMYAVHNMHTCILHSVHMILKFLLYQTSVFMSPLILLLCIEWEKYLAFNSVASVAIRATYLL